MYDPSAAYRTGSVLSSGPVAQVVLLYEGAIRFATVSVAALERGDREAAHRASIRCQAVVGQLQEVLDLSAGPLASQLDNIYRFCLSRLVTGNLTHDPAPAHEVVGLLRPLLDAWRELDRPATARRSEPVAIRGSIPAGHAAADQFASVRGTAA